jgi:hypothetical protein
MEPNLVLEKSLEPVLNKLKLLEPLIYAANDGKQREYFDQLLAPEFWEVGASGKKYSRQFVLDVLDERQRRPAAEAWQATEFHLQEVAANTFLLTYTLHQSSRTSRRSTLWRDTPTGWSLVYHQGTVVESRP